MQRHTILIVLDYAGLNNTQYSAVCRSGMADSPASRYSIHDAKGLGCSSGFGSGGGGKVGPKNIARPSATRKSLQGEGALPDSAGPAKY